jgi:hypothetical protein
VKTYEQSGAFERLRDLASLEPPSDLDAKILATAAQRAQSAESLTSAEALLNTVVSLGFAVYVVGYVIQSVLW